MKQAGVEKVKDIRRALKRTMLGLGECLPYIGNESPKVSRKKGDDDNQVS
jgi:hypothetical protein